MKIRRLLFFVSCFFFSVNLFSSNYYWVGGSGNWSDLSHWVTTSGGSTHKTVLPTANDNVLFDSLSFTTTGQIVTINVSAAKCKNMDWSTALHSPSFTGPINDSVVVSGSLKFNSAMSNGFPGDFYFTASSSTDTIIKTNGIALNRNAYFIGGGKYTLLSSFICSNTLFFQRGTLNTAGKNVTCKTFNAVSPSSRSLKLGSSVITVTGNGAAWDGGSSGLSIVPGTSQIVFSYAGMNNLTFNSGGALINYNVVNFAGLSIKLLNSGTFDTLSIAAGATLTLPNQKTQKINMLDANGTCGNPIEIKSDGAAVSTLFQTSAFSIVCNYLRLSLIAKSGTGTLTANNSIIEIAPCANWIVNPVLSSTTFYWIGGNGKWSNASHWSATSGGAPGTCIPGPSDDVEFNMASGFSSGDSVIIDKNAYCNSMIWTGVLPNPQLFGTGTKLEIKNSLTFVSTMIAPFTGDYKFVGTSTQTINLSGVQLNGDIYFNGTGGEWDLTDNLKSSKKITIQSGHLNTQNNDVECFNFISNTGTGRQLTLGSSVVKLTGYNSAWDVTVPFILNAGTSEIICNTATSNLVTFKGAGLIYNNLTLSNKYTSIASGNTFNIISIPAGRSLTLQSGMTQTIDSLNCQGTCSQPITIEASSTFGAPANISKTGFDSIFVNYVYLKNITASTTAPVRHYMATNSFSQNTTTGWIITGGGAGKKMYWIGGTGNWSSNAHWSLGSGGAATSCIPTKADTVLFDANSFSATGQIVNIDLDGYCNVMDWTGALFNPKLFLIRNLIIGRKAKLTTIMQVSRYNKTPQIQFLPNNNNIDFDSKKVPLFTDILFNGQNASDTLHLMNHLYMSDTTSFSMIKGTLITNNDSIRTGSMNFLTPASKTVKLGSSYVDLTYGWNVFSGGTMNLNSGTSAINIKGWPHTINYFYGDSLTYHNVIIASTKDTITSVSGSNVFNNLTIKPGVKATVTAATTQTINGTFTADGTCVDSITIKSSTAIPIIISQSTGSVTTRCMRLKNITRTGGATYNTLFSSNQGGVTGWTFLPDSPTTANFTFNHNICFGDSVVFTNTSTSYLNDSITCKWSFGDGDSAFIANPPAHTYTTPGKKIIRLTTTYLASNCTSTHIDSINVNSPFVALVCSDNDSTICDGTSVKFTANGLTGSMFQFTIDGIPQGGFSAIDSLVTTSLTNGQVVSVNVSLNGCTGSSLQAIPITVNPSPTVTLNSSDANDSICVGTSVTFTGSGAHKYRFYINNVAQGFYTTNPAFTTSALTNGQIVKVIGLDTVSGCTRTGTPIDTMTVSAYPTPTMTRSTGNIICAGTPVTFTGSGASLYEFFINAVSQGAPSATNTFTTTSLSNGDIVTLKGTTNNCTSTSINIFTFIVNQPPNVTVSNSSVGDSICAGQSVVFTASGASTYQFFIDNISQGAASGNNIFTTSTLTNGQVVKVRGISNSCSDTTSGNTFTVNPLPVVTLSSSSATTTICLNQSVTFTAGGTGATLFEFFINGISQGIASPVNTFTTSSITNGQTIIVKGYSTAGCFAYSNQTYTFTVLPSPIVNFYCSDLDSTICFGQSITFTSTGTNDYEFFVDGISQGASGTTNTFSTSSLPVGTPVVTVTGTNTSGCSSTSATSFPITVNPIPTITLTSSDADNIICNGTPVTFTASGATNYQFYVNGVSQGALTAIDTFATSTLTNLQTVTVSGNQNGCSSVGTSSYSITVNPIPYVTLSSSDLDNIICQGQSVTFTGNGAANYEFFVNAISQGAPSATTTFTTSALTSSDSIGVIGTSSGCSNHSTTNITITVNPLPTVSLTCSDSDTAICAGESVSFNASEANLYQYFINAVPQGAPSINSTFTTTSLTNGDIVTVEGVTNYGCSQVSSESYQFTVSPLPIIILASSDADNQLCTGQVVNFTASGGGQYEFFINTISQGAMDTIDTFSSNSISNLQTVSVKGSNNGCLADGTTSYTFHVYTYPVVNFTTDTPSLNICDGQSVTFTASGANLFQYYLNGIAQGAPTTSNTYTTTSIANNDSVSVEGINGVCPSAASQSFIYNVTQYPVVAVSSSDADNIICYGENVTFTASGANSYEFLINGISQGTASTANTYSTTLLDNNDVVSVKGYNGICGIVSTNVFAFTVHKMNLVITSSPANLICQGSPITFTASGADQYQFFVNAVSQGAMSANNTFTSASLTNASIITFKGKNNSTGCVQDGDYEQFVNVIPNPAITANGSTTLCQNDSLALQSNSANGNQWLLNGSPINNGQDSIYYVHASGNYSVEVSQGGNGTLWSLGADNNGQLGDSTLLNSILPRIIKHIHGIAAVDAGNEFNIARDSSGNVYTWGTNQYGQLGDGTFTNYNFPYQIPGITGAAGIAAGANHSLVITATGGIQSFGQNSDGQLGIGNNGAANFPTSVPGLTGITAVSGGEKHSLALENNGTVWAWGDNQFGQLGDGTYSDKNIPVQVTGLTNIIAISAGKHHSMALKADSTVWVWGSNALGQLGIGSTTSSDTAIQIFSPYKFIAISAGGEHSLLLSNNGKVFSFGNNQFGQLGDGTITSHNSPLAINGFNGVTKIITGTSASFAIKQDLSVWGWGYNASGQIGNATTVDIHSPAHITALSGAGQLAPGLNHTVAAMMNGANCVSNSVSVTVNPAAPVFIYPHLNDLSTDAGVSYQWYYNGNPILNGTHQSQPYVGPGYYSVQVTYANGCTVTSDSYAHLVGIAETTDEAIINLFPNPTSGEFTIEVQNLKVQSLKVEIMNVVGGIIFQSEIHNSKSKINIGECGSGMYFVRVIDSNSMTVYSHRVVKE